MSACRPLPLDTGDQAVLALVREAEGTTLVLELEAARRSSLPLLMEAAWITLGVHSDLAAVGMTAAFAKALTEAGLSCNVIAGAFHDHLLVPRGDADRAMAALRALQDRSSGRA